jgi:hypothetical protein
MNSYKLNKELSEEKQEAEEDAKCTAQPPAAPTSRPGPDLHTNPATPHHIHTPGEILRMSERLTNVLKSRYDV